MSISQIREIRSQLSDDEWKDFIQSVESINDSLAAIRNSTKSVHSEMLLRLWDVQYIIDDFKQDIGVFNKLNQSLINRGNRGSGR